jgi:hypothetical protein
MVMAQFCARLRKRQGLSSVSMRDIYQHSTIRALATAVSAAIPGLASGGHGLVGHGLVGHGLVGHDAVGSGFAGTGVRCSRMAGGHRVGAVGIG